MFSFGKLNNLPRDFHETSTRQFLSVFSLCPSVAEVFAYFFPGLNSYGSAAKGVILRNGNNITLRFIYKLICFHLWDSTECVTSLPQECFNQA